MRGADASGPKIRYTLHFVHVHITYSLIGMNQRLILEVIDLSNISQKGSFNIFIYMQMLSDIYTSIHTNINTSSYVYMLCTT